MFSVWDDKKSPSHPSGVTEIFCYTYTMKKFIIHAQVWIWPIGQSPWHFVYIDKASQDKIEKVAQKHHMGMIRVSAKIGKTVWETSLLPHKKEDKYLLAIKKQIRIAEGIHNGDTVKIELCLI